jgi:sensor domain CHASE-containing protein
MGEIIMTAREYLVNEINGKLAELDKISGMLQQEGGMMSVDDWRGINTRELFKMNEELTTINQQIHANRRKFQEAQDANIEE